MIFVDWKEEAIFKKDGIPTDTEQFWIGIFRHQRFKELATFILTCLITPVSNAVVERIFSLVSSVKTKARNRMQLKLLDAIIRIRAELVLSQKCCNNFSVTQQMLQNLSIKIVYDSSDENLDLDLLL